MQVTLKCKVSLSKKMRNLLQNGGSVVLTADSINSGKGEGLLVLKDENNNSLDFNDLMGKETSIMLTPISVVEGMGAPVTSIFANGENNRGGVSGFSNQNPQPPQQQYEQQPPQYQQQPPQGQQQPPQGQPQYGEQPQYEQQPPQQRSPIDRLAATQPPEQGQNAHSYYAPDEMQLPQQFAQSQNPDFLKYIKNYDELVHAVHESKEKRSDIDPDNIHNQREKALAGERREMEESIGMDAYIVNEKCASLSINDIGIVLPLNMPKNLGHVSAKRLASSREMWSLLSSGMIRLVSPKEAQHLLKNAGTMTQTYVPELPIYDSAYEAEDNVFHGSGAGGGERTNTPILDLGMQALEGPSEEMQNLRMSGRGGQPQQPQQQQQQQRVVNGGNASSLSGGTRRSFHGSGGGGINEESSLEDIYSGSEYEINRDDRHVPSQSRRNSKGHKTVANRHRP